MEIIQQNKLNKFKNFPTDLIRVEIWNPCRCNASTASFCCKKIPPKYKDLFALILSVQGASVENLLLRIQSVLYYSTCKFTCCTVPVYECSLYCNVTIMYIKFKNNCIKQQYLAVVYT